MKWVFQFLYSNPQKNNNMTENEDYEIKKLLIEYRNIVNRLKEKGIIRTTKVVSDYGEYVAAKKLGLQRDPNPSNKGYDAIDEQGRKYEIKTRKATAWNKPTIFPVNEDQLRSADFIIYVEFDDDWNLVKLLRIPTSEVQYNKYKRVILNKNLVNKFTVL